MTRPFGRAAAVAMLIASSLWACSTTPTQPTPITTTTTTTNSSGGTTIDSFSGTLALGGTNYHFLSVLPGTVTTTLTALGPDPSVTIGLSVGVWNGLTCTPVVVNEAAKLNSVLVGLATAANPLCLQVFDVGGLAEQVTYTVTVSHY